MGETRKASAAEEFLAGLSAGSLPNPEKTKKPMKTPDVHAILESLGILEPKQGTKKADTDVEALIGRALAKKKQEQQHVLTPVEQLLAGKEDGQQNGFSQPVFMETASAFEAVFAGNTSPGANGIFEDQFISSETMRNQVARRGQAGPLRVAAYIRVSSDSAAQEDSYEIQEQYFSNLLARNKDWESAGIYSDYGISATSKEKRTGFRRLLRHCQEGRIDRIICKSISRFARNTQDFLKAMGLLKDCGVTILFEREALDTAEHYSEFIVTTLAAIAQEESRSISTNILWGNSKRFPEGKVRNRDIYGYRYAEGEDAYQEMENGYRLRRVEIVEEEARVVRRIFQDYVSGLSTKEIAMALNREHIPEPVYRSFSKNTSGKRKTPDGKLKAGLSEGWTSRAISQLLERERYTGDVLVQKTFIHDHLTHRQKVNEGEMPQYLIRNHHPAIISRELFEEAKHRRELEKSARPRKNRGHWPFEGRLVCAECGRHYHVQSGGVNRIWKCASTKLNNGKNICHSQKIYEEQLVRMFRRAVTERFQLTRTPFKDDVKEADLLSGRYGASAGNQPFTDGATRFVQQMKQRLESIQHTDCVERDRTFIKQQILAIQMSIRSDEKKMRTLRTKKEAMEVRHSLLGEEIEEDTLAGIANQMVSLGKRLEEEKEDLRKQEERLSYLEEYWEALEADYIWREKAIQWMSGLPYGQEGLVEFLNGMTAEYVKAFAISIMVYSPLKYTVHWFDDTRTDVTMDSNITDYRYTADYFNGHHMVEKKTRRRKI